MRALLAALLVLALLAAAAGFAFADGGPEPQRPQPGVTVYAPVVERWSLLVAGAGTDVGGVLCDEDDACEAARLNAAAADGRSCTLAMQVWLATAPRGTPALREVEVFVSAVAFAGGGELREDGILNSSVSASEFPLPWDAGWWWRHESERVALAFPVPCDTRTAKASINVRARDLDGDARTAAQTAELVLVE